MRTRLSLIFSIALTGASPLLAAELSELKASIEFCGGSARVQKIDQATRTIQILPSEHKDRGWVCWWYFKLEGITPGDTITIEAGGGVWAQPQRAVFSLDNEKWQHTDAGTLSGGRMIYKQKIDAKEAWFAWGAPFTQKHAQALCESAAKTCPQAKVFELCKSADGRSVPALRINGSTDAKPFGVWISARQHAWEAGSSWVCKGLVDWLVSDDPKAVELRKKAVIVIVPVMDIDDVELGAGGKGRVPNDHNRDWCDEPHWPEVRAALKEIRAMHAAGGFDLFIDLHNPAANDKMHFFHSPKSILSELGYTNQQTFFSLAKEEINGAIPFGGQIKESGPTYDKENWKKISGNYVHANISNTAVATTLETPWNMPESVPQNYQQVGRQLGQVIERYLKASIRP
jgi:hypothetical protein